MNVEVIRGIGSTDPTYIPPNPIDPATPLPGVQPLPAGSNVAVGLEQSNNGWNPETFFRTVGTAADIAARAGVNLGPLEGFNWGQAFATIGAAAGIGAAVTGPGAPLGAVLGAIVGVVAVVGQQWAAWQDPHWWHIPREVKEWATAYAQNDFIVEAQTNLTNNWQSVAECARALCAYWVSRYGAVLTGGGRFYSNIPDAVYVDALGGVNEATKFYAALGVDLHATGVTRDAVGDQRANGIVMMYKVNVNIPTGTVPSGAKPTTTVQPGTNPPPPGSDAPYVGAPVVAAAGAAALGLVLSRSMS